jgi:hypothetical protein
MEKTCIQYTPLDNHCTNPAKCAICTWKNYFLAGMAGLPKSFPIANWCHLTMQCNSALNMLCPCCQNPLLLAHKVLKKLFSFNATPMAPLGTEVLVHMKPNQQCTWGYHASKAWYLSHATKHYRCIRVLMADTGSKRITNTFLFKHHAIPVLDITATDRIINATTRLTTAIAGGQDAPPKEMEAIQSLCTLLLGKVAPLPPPTPSILPTPPPPAQVVNKDEPVIIWNPHLVQPALPTHNLSTNNINSQCNTPAIAADNSNVDSPIPSQCTSLPCHHLIRPLQNRPLTCNQLRLCSAHMIGCTHAHTCTLHSSTFTSSLVCICG